MLSINDNRMVIERYREVLYVSDTCVRVRMQKQQLQVDGTKLHVLALEKEELLLEGEFEGLRFTYDE